MSNDNNIKPSDASASTDPAKNAALARRNKFLGIALTVFVITLGIVSYFRISALSP